LPYVQKVPNRILRSEWATRISQQLRLEEPVLRAALSKAASERRSEVKVRPELVRHSAMPAERRVHVCDFSNPDDAFSRFILERWRAFHG